MKINWLAGLFIGCLLTLLVLGFNTPLLPKFQIQYTLQGSQSDWLSAIGTLFATITALVIAIWGKSLRKLSFWSDIRIIDSQVNFQPSKEGRGGYVRFLFKNYGNDTAEDVEVYIDHIQDNDSDRLNFLPVPLRWTHDGRSKRSFHPNQYGYLDFCNVHDIGNRSDGAHFTLAAGSGVPSYEQIATGKSQLHLIIFQKSGQIKKYNVNISYNISDKVPNITNIAETIN